METLRRYGWRLCWTIVLAVVLLPVPAMAHKLRLQLQWVPQAQFAGYYVAHDLGWYEEAGLEVEILPHGPEFAPGRIMKQDQADVVVLNLSEALQLMDAGVALVNLQQFKRQSTLVFVALAGAGITTPTDLDGRLVARWGHFAAQAEALFRRYDIKPRVVNQGASMVPLRSGVVDAAMATRYNEMVQLYLSGLDDLDVTVLPLADHVASLPEDGVYVRADQWQAHEEALRTFVEVTRRGWQYAFDHPETAIDLVMRRAQQAGQETNRAHQTLMLSVLRDYYLDEEGQLHDGQMSEDDFNTGWQLLRQYGLISGDNVPVYEQFHQR